MHLLVLLLLSSHLFSFFFSPSPSLSVFLSLLRRAKDEQEVGRIHCLLDQVESFQKEQNWEEAAKCFSRLYEEHDVVASNQRKLWRGDAGMLKELVQRWEIEENFVLGEAEGREGIWRQRTPPPPPPQVERGGQLKRQHGGELLADPEPSPNKRPRDARSAPSSMSRLLVTKVGNVTLEMMYV